MNLKQCLKIVEDKKVEMEIYKKEMNALEEQIENETKRCEDLEKLKNVIMNLSTESRSELIEYIEELVSSCLSTAFNDKYIFEIEINEKHNQQECDFVLNNNGLKLKPREDMCGDSLLDICSIGLRAAEFVLDPSVEPIANLDEPCRNIRFDKKPLVRTLIQSLSKDLGIQFNIITHDREYESMADNIINIGDE